jgi:hypothetical protein
MFILVFLFISIVKGTERRMIHNLGDLDQFRVWGESANAYRINLNWFFAALCLSLGISGTMVLTFGQTCVTLIYFCARVQDRSGGNLH